jgi:hypothetical protein
MMVISDRHKYLFIQKPMCASSNMGEELVRNYGGTSILEKHTTYQEFKSANPNNSYLSFCFTRNPLDQLITMYCRARWAERTTKWYLDHIHDKEWQSKVFTDKLSFSEFCDNIPEWFDHPDFYNQVRPEIHSDQLVGIDIVGKYENLVSDWTKVINLLNLTQVPYPDGDVLPKRDFAKKYPKNRDFLSYYTPDLRPLIKEHFAPSMRAAGYEFPQYW